MMAVGKAVPVRQVAPGQPGFEEAVQEAHAALVDAVQELYNSCKHLVRRPAVQAGGMLQPASVTPGSTQGGGHSWQATACSARQAALQRGWSSIARQMTMIPFAAAQYGWEDRPLVIA
jgi:hypothetical protein